MTLYFFFFFLTSYGDPCKPMLDECSVNVYDEGLLCFGALPPLSRGGQQLTVVTTGISSSFTGDKGQTSVQIYRGTLEREKSSGLTKANQNITLQLAKRQSNKQPANSRLLRS